MSDKVLITQMVVEKLAIQMAVRILTDTQVFEVLSPVEYFNKHQKTIRIYGVPRGGIPVAYLVKGILEKDPNIQINITDTASEANIIVDDIIDSGKTQEEHSPFGLHFYALIDKRESTNKYYKKWVIFPWEGNEVGSCQDIPLRFFQAIGEDSTRPGLIDTPARVIKSWGKLYGGYKGKVEDVIKVFPNEENYDQMIISKHIDFYSTCEHHILPFYGKITIAYIPRDTIVGLSKLSRLVEIFSRRLQVQERLTQQIKNAIIKHLSPVGVGVYCEAVHMCMISRGVEKQNATMITTALSDKFRVPEIRSEFLNLVKD